MEEIVDKLIALYKNKPAFVDELNKIKKIKKWDGVTLANH
jgi:hypothetical protein